MKDAVVPKRRRPRRGGAGARRRRREQPPRAPAPPPASEPAPVAPPQPAHVAPWVSVEPVRSLSVGVSHALVRALRAYGPQRWGAWTVQAGTNPGAGVEAHLTYRVLSVTATPGGAGRPCKWLWAEDDSNADTRHAHVPRDAQLPCDEVQQALEEVARELGEATTAESAAHYHPTTAAAAAWWNTCVPSGWVAPEAAAWW